MRCKLSTLLAVTLAAAGCDKSTPDTEAPAPAEQEADAAAADADAADAEAEAEQADAGGEDEQAAAEEPEPEPPKDYFTVATFNLAWGHDELDDGPKRSQENGADTPENWDWKVKQIAELITKNKPDVVALHELGGSLEATVIVSAIKEAGGPEYKWAFQESDDPQNGHDIAILTRFEVTTGRRLDLHMRRHLAAEIKLPTGDEVTVVAIHPPDGTNKRSVKARRKQVDALRREINSMLDDRPVIVLATMSSNIVPADDDYDKSAAGILAGADTSSDEDDCQESADSALVLETMTNGELGDRIVSCGLTMRDAMAEGRSIIVRDIVDPWDKPWAEVPIDKAPHRDVSDHLMLIAQIELPKPPPEQGEGEDKKDE